MKKLVLKKDVVARINNDQMNQLKGGNQPEQTGPQYPTCMQTCHQEQTCPDYNTCGNTCDQHDSCKMTCAYTCQGAYTCGLSCGAGSCETCYIRCTDIY